MLISGNRHPCTFVVGLQNALEGLAIVIASQSQFFVDIVSFDFQFGVVVIGNLT